MFCVCVCVCVVVVVEDCCCCCCYSINNACIVLQRVFVFGIWLWHGTISHIITHLWACTTQHTYAILTSSDRFKIELVLGKWADACSDRSRRTGKWDPATNAYSVLGSNTKATITRAPKRHKQEQTVPAHLVWNCVQCKNVRGVATALCVCMPGWVCVYLAGK